MTKETPKAQWITEKEVAAMTNFAVQTLRNFRHQGRGPAYSKIGRAIRYNLDTVAGFMESKRVLPRDEK